MDHHNSNSNTHYPRAPDLSNNTLSFHAALYWLTRWKRTFFTPRREEGGLHSPLYLLLLSSASVSSTRQKGSEYKSTAVQRDRSLSLGLSDAICGVQSIRPLGIPITRPPLARSCLRSWRDRGHLLYHFIHSILFSFYVAYTFPPPTENFYENLYKIKRFLISHIYTLNSLI